jgi:hypothetical protein
VSDGGVVLAKFICPFCGHAAVVTGGLEGIVIDHDKHECEVFAASSDREYIALVNRMRDLAQRRKVAQA